MHTANIKKLIARAEAATKPPRYPIIVRALRAWNIRGSSEPCDEPFTDKEIRRVLQAVGTKDSFVIDAVDKEISAAHGIK